MSKQDIIEFFDGFAPQWDADMVRDEMVITTILDNAGITSGVSVLDVAPIKVVRLYNLRMTTSNNVFGCITTATD